MAKDSKITTLDDTSSQILSDSPQSAAAVVGTNHDAELSGRKVRVTFFEQEGDLGKDAIFASINGVGYNIPRGVPVDIPVEVLEVFQNAKTRAVQTTAGGGQSERDIMRFAFQVHGELPAES